MSECTHDCSTCGSDCASRTEPQSLIEKPNQMSSIGKVIGVVSGKGGVGKTMVSSLLAVSMQRLGKNVGRLTPANSESFPARAKWELTLCL